MSPAARVGWIVGVAVGLSGAGCLAAGPASSAPARVPVAQALLVLRQGHVARTEPRLGAHRIAYVAPRRPLTGDRTALPILGATVRRGGRSWVRVRLPGRPNGHTGWLWTTKTRRASTPWRVAVDLSRRRVTVYEAGRVARRFAAIVGKPSTPTPEGHFFVEEAVALSSRDPGGPFALASSARSHVLQEFDGGPGQIALHGTNHLSGTLGTAASHGCIRLSTRSIAWMAHRIGAGVPLNIAR